MKRNLKFWTRYTWESAGVVLGAAAVLAVISLFSAEGLDFATFAAVVPYYLCIAAIFVMMMLNSGSQTLYVPLLLSMGETRRNVLLGFHYYRVLIIAVTAALCSLIWLLAPGEASAAGLRSIPTILCVLLIASALGSIMGTVFVRWKWAGTVLIIILCGVAGGTVGFAGATGGGFLRTAQTLEIVSYLETLPWWLLAAVPAALAADVAFQWMLLRRQEVKL
ncbi:MAG: hypothetical protein K2O45_05220 [Oscillospiraceae bacterium]|nr:hypothetical protein [Oscillospiraceae bacterium]